MEIQRTNNGFTEFLDHSIIRRIDVDFNGSCRIVYSDGTEKEITLETNVYHLQYGIPASEDGSMVFLGNWEDGVWAIDSNSNSRLWHFKQKRIRGVFVFDKYVLALKQGSSIYKLDILSGEELDEIKSSTIERYFKIDRRHVLVDRIKGKLSIINTEDMVIEKSFSEKEANPNRCLAQIIQNAFYKDGNLFISGFEKYAQSNALNAEQKEFIRSLS